MLKKKLSEVASMVEQQSALDKWFLRQDVIDQLLESGEESEEAALGDKIPLLNEKRPNTRLLGPV